MADDKKVIFSMQGVSKVLPSGKQILKDIVSILKDLKSENKLNSYQKSCFF